MHWLQNVCIERQDMPISSVTFLKTFDWIVFIFLLTILRSPTSVCFWHGSPQCGRASSFMRFPDHAQRITTVGTTPLDEWSVRRREPYLTTHNTHNRQTSIPIVGFEPTISAGERSQNYAIDRAATGTSSPTLVHKDICICVYNTTKMVKIPTVF